MTEAKQPASCDLLDRLQALNSETAAILKEARADGSKSHDTALKAIAHLEKQIELEGEWLGELTEGLGVGPVATPEWRNLRTAILTALEPFPAARLAVLEAIKRVGA